MNERGVARRALTELDRRLALGDVPAVMREVLMDRPWTLERLFALELPVDQVDVATLTWQLDLPWWRLGQRWFSVTPNEVRRQPDVFHEQWERTMRADLEAPIHTRDSEDRVVILDGVHRLLKADILAVRHLQRRHVPAALLSHILADHV